MNVWIINNTAKVYVRKRYLNEVLNFCKEHNLQRSIIIVKKGLRTTYCVKIYKCGKYALDLISMTFNK